MILFLHLFSNFLWHVPYSRKLSSCTVSPHCSIIRFSFGFSQGLTLARHRSVEESQVHHSHTPFLIQHRCSARSLSLHNSSFPWLFLLHVSSSHWAPAVSFLLCPFDLRGVIGLPPLLLLGFTNPLFFKSQLTSSVILSVNYYL